MEIFQTLDKGSDTAIVACDSINDAQKIKMVDLALAWASPELASCSIELAELDSGHTVPLHITKLLQKKMYDICWDAMEYIKNENPANMEVVKDNVFLKHSDCSRVAFDYLLDKRIERKTVGKTLDSLKSFLSSIKA